MAHFTTSSPFISSSQITNLPVNLLHPRPRPLCLRPSGLVVERKPRGGGILADFQDFPFGAADVQVKPSRCPGQLDADPAAVVRTQFHMRAFVAVRHAVPDETARRADQLRVAGRIQRRRIDSIAPILAVRISGWRRRAVRPSAGGVRCRRRAPAGRSPAAARRSSPGRLRIPGHLEV